MVSHRAQQRRNELATWHIGKQLGGRHAQHRRGIHKVVQAEAPAPGLPVAGRGLRALQPGGEFALGLAEGFLT